MNDNVRIEEIIESKKIVVFGTGQNADIFFKKTSYNVSYIIDNDMNKWGNVFYNRLINAPEILRVEDFAEIFVILTFAPSGATYNRVSKQLNELGLSENIHYLSMYYLLPKDFPYEEIKPLANYAPWKTDIEFGEVYNTIKNNTLVDRYRCYELWSLIQQVSKLSGAIIEIGVWKGGTGALIAKRAQLCGINETVYLCDTFNGVVKASPSYDNVYVGGEHSDTSENIVKELVFEELQLESVRLLKGVFPDETGKQVTDQSFRFCHIDVDAFLSAKDIFEWIWGKLVVGGIVVFDDYGFMTCEGITSYVNTLRTEGNVLFVHNINGHAILIKLC